ncbi:MAG TPA: YdbH domain-containing protein [Lacunisphaera sp.]|nr:YdbH domain-containing protein [Lacunisphaera sp.]
MSSPARRTRKIWIALAIVALVVAGGYFLRPWLGNRVIRTALAMAGATEIRFRPVTATPGHVVVEDLEFRVQGQDFAAKRLTLVRPRWWRMTLGRVQVEGMRVAWTIDDSDRPWDWSSPPRDDGGPAEPLGLPVESLALDGEVTVRAAGQPDQRVAVKLEGSPKGKLDWAGTLLMDGPGFKLAGAGTLLGLGTELDFEVQRAELDLEIWQGFIQRNLFLPGGPWQMGGRLTGVAAGHVTARRFAATARVSLRDGWMRAHTQDIAAAGAEAELEFSDLWKLRTKSGVLRLREMHIGRLALTDVSTDFGLWGAENVSIARSSFSALGGKAEVAPFKYVLRQPEVMTTLQVDGIDLARLKTLTTAGSTDITGRVGGSLPLRVHEFGVRIEPGAFLALQPAPAELGLDAVALVRSGARLSGGSMAVLRTLGDGPMHLQLEQLRLDIRPADLPLGCSARLHVAGETPAGRIEFDFDVNGTIERYADILTARR